MEVERRYNKWTRRVPPLDLTNVNVCPREAENRWHKIQPSPKKMAFNVRSSDDRLPFGE